MRCCSRRCLSLCCAAQCILLGVVIAWAWPLLLLVHTSATTVNGWERLLQESDRSLNRCPGARDRSVWNVTQTYPVLDAGLRAHWRTIRAELEDLERKVGSKTLVPFFRQTDRTGAGIESYRKDGQGWRALWLKLYGINQPAAFKHFPETMRLINALPYGLLSSAMISIIEPGVSLKPHRGDFKGVLRYHVALEVPSGDGIPVPTLAVANVLFPKEESLRDMERNGRLTHLTWKEGDHLLFDDTFIHRVAWAGAKENLGSAQQKAVADDARRVILFVDVVRPGCDWWLDAFLKAIADFPPVSRLMGFIFPRLDGMRESADREWARIDALVSNS